MDVLKIVVAVGEFKGNLQRAGLDVDDNLSCAINALIELAIIQQSIDDAQFLRTLHG